MNTKNEEFYFGKITMIKMARRFLGCGLVEAKVFVEAFLRIAGIDHIFTEGDFDAFQTAIQKTNAGEIAEVDGELIMIVKKNVTMSDL